LETSLFESKYCVVTDYGLFGNGTISVRNRQTDGAVNGPFNGILGWASFNNRTGLGTADGSLSVYLQLPAPAPQGIAAPYDVILLGPATYGPYGLYQYAVVSDPFELSLFVLARDVDTYFSQYNATVMAQLRADGFINPVNEPRQTVQKGCAPYSETDLWTCVGGARLDAFYGARLNLSHRFYSRSAIPLAGATCTTTSKQAESAIKIGW